MISNQRRFKISVHPPLDVPVSEADKLHLTDAAAYVAPVFRLRSFPGLELDLIVRDYLRRHVCIIYLQFYFFYIL